MMHEHIEYEGDTTEHQPGVVVGYRDPQEVTGSDAETEPLEPAPHVIPMDRRWHRWRLYRDEFGRWNARQPAQIEVPMFRLRTAHGTVAQAYGYQHHDPRRVLAELQLAVLIAKSHE